MHVVWSFASCKFSPFHTGTGGKGIITWGISSNSVCVTSAYSMYSSHCAIQCVFLCSDIDECVEQSPCNGNAQCANTPGSFTCDCNEGYSGDGMTCTGQNFNAELTCILLVLLFFSSFCCNLRTEYCNNLFHMETLDTAIAQ